MTTIIDPPYDEPLDEELSEVFEFIDGIMKNLTELFNTNFFYEIFPENYDRDLFFKELESACDLLNDEILYFKAKINLQNNVYSQKEKDDAKFILNQIGFTGEAFKFKKNVVNLSWEGFKSSINGGWVLMAKKALGFLLNVNTILGSLIKLLNAADRLKEIKDIDRKSVV